MNRRHFLATTTGVSTALVAGCFQMGGGGPWYDLSFHDIGSDFGASVAVTPREQSANQREVLRDAVDNGTAYTYGWKPFSDDGDAYVARDHTYYRVTSEATGSEREMRRLTVRGRVVPDDELPVDAVNISAFPERDIPALKHAIAASQKDASGDRTKADDRFYVFHDVNHSVSELVPEPEHRYVTHGEKTIELIVEERTVTEAEYATTLTEVADSRDAFDAYARDNLLDGNLEDPPLPDAQAELVRKALDSEYNSYGEEVPLSDEFKGLLRRCGYTVEVKTAEDGDTYTEIGGDAGPMRRYVYFDGRYYRTTLSQAVA